MASPSTKDRLKNHLRSVTLSAALYLVGISLSLVSAKNGLYTQWLLSETGLGGTNVFWTARVGRTRPESRPSKTWTLDPQIENVLESLPPEAPAILFWRSDLIFRSDPIFALPCKLENKIGSKIRSDLKNKIAGASGSLCRDGSISGAPENWVLSPPPPQIQGEIIYTPPPLPPIFGLKKKAFLRGGGWGCIFWGATWQEFYTPPPPFIHPPPLEGYFQGWGGWGCLKFSPRIKFREAPDAPSKRTTKNAPSKRTLLTSFQRSLAEPPQQAAAAPTTHTRSDEEWDSRTSEKRSKEYVLMVHLLVVRLMVHQGPAKNFQWIDSPPCPGLQVSPTWDAGSSAWALALVSFLHGWTGSRGLVLQPLGDCVVKSHVAQELSAPNRANWLRLRCDSNRE